MSDVTLTLTDATPVNLTMTTTAVTLSFDCFDALTWLSTLVAYDSHEDAAAAGVVAYKASAAHNSATIGTLFYIG